MECKKPIQKTGQGSAKMPKKGIGKEKGISVGWKNDVDPKIRTRWFFTYAA